MGKQFHCFAAVTLDHGIVQNKNFYTFRSGERIKCGNHFDCKEQKKSAPVIGSFIKETVIRIL